MCLFTMCLFTMYLFIRLSVCLLGSMGQGEDRAVRTLNCGLNFGDFGVGRLKWDGMMGKPRCLGG